MYNLQHDAYVYSMFGPLPLGSILNRREKGGNPCDTELKSYSSEHCHERENAVQQHAWVCDQQALVLHLQYMYKHLGSRPRAPEDAQPSQHRSDDAPRRGKTV